MLNKFRIAEIIEEGCCTSLVRFEGDKFNSLIFTDEINTVYPVVKKKAKKKDKVEINLYEIHLHVW